MIAFAYYRLPYLHHATYVAQHEGEPEVLSSVAELNGKEGFVIAPFAPSSECPVVLMHPDESKLLSAEGAKNASRCGTSCVVTQQDLRRDVAESTSGRNFGGIYKVLYQILFRFSVEFIRTREKFFRKKLLCAGNK